MKHVLSSNRSGADENSAAINRIWTHDSYLQSVSRSWTHDSFFSIRKPIHREEKSGEKCPDTQFEVPLS